MLSLKDFCYFGYRKILRLSKIVDFCEARVKCRTPSSSFSRHTQNPLAGAFDSRHRPYGNSFFGTAFHRSLCAPKRGVTATVGHRLFATRTGLAGP
jgi:hypothetical protein